MSKARPATHPFVVAYQEPVPRASNRSTSPLSSIEADQPLLAMILSAPASLLSSIWQLLQEPAFVSTCCHVPTMGDGCAETAPTKAGPRQRAAQSEERNRTI